MSHDETQYNNILTIIEKSPKISPETVYNDVVINEANAMALVFSESFNYNDADVSYFLRFKTNDVYGGIQENAKYYNNNMISDVGIAANNDILTDIDLSYFNSQEIIKYYFLIDTISEIYGYLMATEKRSNMITIKCRYTIRDGVWKLYTKGDHYTFNIRFAETVDTMGGKITSYKLSDASDESDVIVKNMCDVISPDIVRHLNYISKTDITHSNALHFHNIETFYKFCRLKLVYRTLMCCHSVNAGAVQIFIQEHFVHCFKNLKKQIIFYNALRNDRQNEVSNEILNTINSLEINNEEVKKHMTMVERNNRRMKALNDTYLKEILYAVFVVAVFFMSIAFIINGLNIQKIDKYILNGIIVMLSILVYGMSYIMTKHYSVEKFEVGSVSDVSDVNNVEQDVVINIENMITDISNNIIISALKREDEFYLHKIDDVHILSRRSSNDLNNSIRNNILLKKTIMFVANLFILSMVLIILSRKYSLWDTFYSIILSYVVLFALYVYDVVRIVQSDPYNYYWRKPVTEDL